MSWANRGLAREKQGDLDGALADYGKAIELDPRSSFAYSNRSSARARRGDHEGAIADAAEAIELAPSDPLPRTNRAASLIDISRTRKRKEARLADLDAAIADLTKVIELTPGAAEAWLNRAAARNLRGDSAGAIADYEHFLGMAPDDPRTKDARADLERLRRAR